MARLEIWDAIVLIMTSFNVWDRYNGLLPIRCQSITWINVELLPIGPLAGNIPGSEYSGKTVNNMAVDDLAPCVTGHQHLNRHGVDYVGMHGLLWEWIVRICVVSESRMMSDLLTHLPPGQNDRLFTGEGFKCIFLGEKFSVFFIKVSLNFVQLTITKHWFR